MTIIHEENWTPQNAEVEFQNCYREKEFIYAAVGWGRNTVEFITEWRKFDLVNTLALPWNVFKIVVVQQMFFVEKRRRYVQRIID